MLNAISEVRLYRSKKWKNYQKDIIFAPLCPVMPRLLFFSPDLTGGLGWTIINIKLCAEFFNPTIIRVSACRKFHRIADFW
jgi:hypothetical protein